MSCTAERILDYVLIRMLFYASSHLFIAASRGQWHHLGDG